MSGNAIQPQYICDGADDHIELQAAIYRISGMGGGEVRLTDGTYHLGEMVDLVPGVNLVGAGTGTTVLEFTRWACLVPLGNNGLSDLSITGPGSIYIMSSNVACTNISMHVTSAHGGAFQVFAQDRVIENISYTNCHAIDCGTHGFLNDGQGLTKTIRNIRYKNCTASNCGLFEREHPWVVGFDLAEHTDIDGMIVENCRAEGSWESGFHFEDAPSKSNVTMKNCAAWNNAQKFWTGGMQADYGAGFLTSGDSQLIDCISGGNIAGFRLLNGVRATHCDDTGSIRSFLASDGGNVLLYDCSSMNAQSWALCALNSHDVTAQNFRVINPIGHPYPALLLGTSEYPSTNITVNLVPPTSPPSPTPTLTGTSTLTPVRTTTSTPMVTPTWVERVVHAVPGSASVPTDTDNDALCDDINGNGRRDFADIVLYFSQMSWIAENEPLSAFDYNANGRIDFSDIVWLFALP